MTTISDMDITRAPPYLIDFGILFQLAKEYPDREGFTLSANIFGTRKYIFWDAQQHAFRTLNNTFLGTLKKQQ